MASQCWAKSPDGRRCEADGGHDGDHLVTITWDDEAAGAVFVTTLDQRVDAALLSPITTVMSEPPRGLRLIDPVVEPVDELVSRPAEEITPSHGPCVGCKHHHFGGQCAKCECYAYIG